MTKWRYRIGAYLLFSLFGSGLVFANPPIKKQLIKEIHKSFDVNSDALLGVQNKYGNITIKTWPRNNISVDVLIKVKTTSESKGKTYLEGLNIDFSSSKSKVGMKTVYPDQENSSWWGSWWNNSNNIDYEVHYTITAPKGISTNLINKYGTIYQGSIEGSSKITNKYGDIILNDVGGDVNLDLGYGKAKISKAGSLDVDIKNSTLSVGKCDAVRMTSKYSDFDFGDCGDMDLNSKYDEFLIESAGQIINNGKYDDFKIGEAMSLNIDTKNTTVFIKKLNKHCRIDTKYGSFKIKSTGPDVELISIESKYTEYEFGLDSDFHLKFLGDYSDLSLDIPHKKYHSEKDGSELQVKAYRGYKDAKLKISADLKYGGLKITDGSNY